MFVHLSPTSSIFQYSNYFIFHCKYLSNGNVIKKSFDWIQDQETEWYEINSSSQKKGKWWNRDLAVLTMDCYMSYIAWIEDINVHNIMSVSPMCSWCQKNTNLSIFMYQHAPLTRKIPAFQNLDMNAIIGSHMIVFGLKTL